MPDLPAEAAPGWGSPAAVQAATEGMPGREVIAGRLADGIGWLGRDAAVTVAGMALLALRDAGMDVTAGGGSVKGCPQTAPESTQSLQKADARVIGQPDERNPGESLSAPHGEHANKLANSHASEHADLRQRYADAIKAAAVACDGNCGRTEEECRDHIGLIWSGTARAGRPDEVTWVEGTTSALADAVLAVRDDELDRLRREVAYVARTGEMWRQLWERVDGERSQAAVRAEQAADILARLSPAIECVLLDHAGELDDEQGRVDANLVELAHVYRELTGFDARTTTEEAGR